MSVLYNSLPCVCGASQWAVPEGQFQVISMRCAACGRPACAFHMWSKSAVVMAQEPDPVMGWLAIALYFNQVVRPIWIIGQAAYFKWFKEICAVDERLKRYCLNCLRLESDENLSDKNFRRFAHSVKRAQRLPMYRYPDRPEEFATPLPFLPQGLVGYQFNKNWANPDALWDEVERQSITELAVPAWMEPQLPKTLEFARLLVA